MSNKGQYDLSFSAGALLGDSFDVVLNNANNIERLINKEELIDYRLMPVNSESSKKRYLLEIMTRIRSVPISVLMYYKEANPASKQLIQFFAVCKRYTIITEFMIKVVRNKWLNLDFDLENFDFRNFIIRKLDQTEISPEITDKTLTKLTQVFFKMLKELGMFSNNKFQKIVFDPVLMKMIHQSGNEWFLDVMLLTDEEKKEGII